MPSNGEIYTGNKICYNCRKTFSIDIDTCPNDGTTLVPMTQNKLVGTTLADRYEILAVAGQGGMSTVYKAKHTYMDRIVAVKILHAHLFSDPVSIHRFQQESKAASSLSHPNVITVFDFGVGEGSAYLVMDYLDGPTIGDLIETGGPIPEKEALVIFRQILKGLAHAHSKGVIHRDLKPRNLILKVEEDGSILVKIVDFGIAKILPQDGELSQHLTQTGEVFGSPIYMSPEQCLGEKLDARADFYSLGCVMYEILTGTPPLVGINAVETLSMHVNDQPIPIREALPSGMVSAQTEQIISKCLQKKLSSRPLTSLEILDALPYDDEIPTSTSQHSTVATRLSKFATNSGTNKIPVQASKRMHHRKRPFLRVSSRSIAIIFGALLTSIFAFVTMYPGPKEDLGTPLQNCIWSIEMSLSNWLMDKQAYRPAVKILEDAFDRADDMGPTRETRNTARMIETLQKLVLAYNGIGDSEKQEASLLKIVQLDGERWEQKAAEMLYDLGETEVVANKLIARNKPVQEFLGDPTLNWAGGAFIIVEVARRLDANKKFVIESTLLEKAERVFSRLYGENYIGLANLMSQHAECLSHQDRLEEIERAQFYPKIVAIQEAAARSSQGIGHKKPLTDAQAAHAPDYIRALLKYGQWLRDRSKYEGPQGAIHYLELAIDYAENCSLIRPDELAEFYMSYAECLQQLERRPESQKFKDKASQVREVRQTVK